MSEERVNLLEENARLKEKIKELEDIINHLKLNKTTPEFNLDTYDLPSSLPPLENKELSSEEISRYGRQMIMKQIGVKGQKLLSRSSVLLVGAGGLASTAALYLAGAGVGRIGIIDYDFVEATNLQRQIIHNESTVGMSKVLSAYKSITQFNSLVECIPYHTLFTSQNALEIMKPYDLILDCTDNVVTRYLINDACVLLNKTLVSGSALRMEGQVLIYNDQRGGPCYRCLFSTPPPREAQGNCSSDGVLGVVPGIIGCIQALEAIKLLAQTGSPIYGKMLVFDASNCSFRTFKIRGRKENCDVCGDSPIISELVDYEQFCQSKADDKQLMLDVIQPDEHIDIHNFAKVYKDGSSHLLLDVRVSNEYEICQLPGSVHIPLSQLSSNFERLKSLVSFSENTTKPIFTLCRLGNDSQLAVIELKKLGYSNVFNIKGGLYQWSQNIDPNFPIY